MQFSTTRDEIFLHLLQRKDEIFKNVPKLQGITYFTLHYSLMHGKRQCANFHVRTLKTAELINAVTFKTANSEHKACTIVMR